MAHPLATREEARVDGFLGEVRIFSFGFAPKGWAYCNGSLLPVNQNPALFSLLGVAYGGNGTTTFGLPDLRGRTPISMGSAGGQSYAIGGQGGATQVTLTTSTMPQHNHAMAARAGVAGDVGSPNGSLPAMVGPGTPGTTINVYAPAGTTVALAGDTVSSAGNGAAHNNLQPYLALNYCICLQGIYPSRQ